jgi:hypothetical protein
VVHRVFEHPGDRAGRWGDFRVFRVPLEEGQRDSYRLNQPHLRARSWAILANQMDRVRAIRDRKVNVGAPPAEVSDFDQTRKFPEVQAP